MAVHSPGPISCGVVAKTSNPRTPRLATSMVESYPRHATGSGSRVEADPGLVGQGGDPLRPQHRRKGAKQFVWVMLREPTARTVPRYAVRELSYYSWYFPYVNERLRRLDRHRDDVVLADWSKVGDRPGITYDSIHLNSRGGVLMAKLIKRTINREALRQSRP